MPRESQSLTRGLTVLNILVQASGPLTATEVAHRCGIHQTTASRILGSLIEAGYVRRVSFREFSPDFGLMALGMDAARHFSVVTDPQTALERCAVLVDPLNVRLSVLWRSKLLYIDRTSNNRGRQVFDGADYPLHLSSPGLLFMLELKPEDAVRELAASRERFGWARPTRNVAATEADVLSQAEKHHRRGTIVLRNWADTGHVTAAIRMPDHEGHPLALSLAGPSDVHSTETIRVLLHECRQLVEAALG